MKVALLLTGQLRTYSMNKFLIMNSIINKYDTDVYLSIDIDNSLQCEYKNTTTKTLPSAVKDAIDFFKPVQYTIVDDFEEEYAKISSRDWYKLLFRQYFVVKNAYKMMMDHSNQTGILYDIVLRLRFDQLIWEDNYNIISMLRCSELNNVIYDDDNTNRLDTITTHNMIHFDDVSDNTIYVLGYGDFKHYKYINDQFFYHTPTLNHFMFTFYDNLDYYLEYCKKHNIGQHGATIESIFYLYMINNNISYKKSNINGIFLRGK